MSEFVPGTSLPLVNPSQTLQPEGRGTVEDLRQGHIGPPLFEKVEQYLSPSEAHIFAAALRAYIRAPKRERSVYLQTGGQTDATTGNLTAKLFQVPAGMEAHISNCTVDAPDSATITPAAPYANAASFAFLAILGQGDNPPNARRGLVAFSPTAAGGPIIPGQWTFGDDDGPVAFANETIYFALVGGSIAAIRSLALQITLRVNLFSVAPS